MELVTGWMRRNPSICECALSRSLVLLLLTLLCVAALFGIFFRQRNVLNKKKQSKDLG